MRLTLGMTLHTFGRTGNLDVFFLTFFFFPPPFQSQDTVPIAAAVLALKRARCNLVQNRHNKEKQPCLFSGCNFFFLFRIILFWSVAVVDGALHWSSAFMYPYDLLLEVTFSVMWNIYFFKRCSSVFFYEILVLFKAGCRFFFFFFFTPPAGGIAAAFPL